MSALIADDPVVTERLIAAMARYMVGHGGEREFPGRTRSVAGARRIAGRAVGGRAEIL